MNNPHFLVVSKQVDFYCRIDIDFYSVRAYKKSGTQCFDYFQNLSNY